MIVKVQLPLGGEPMVLVYNQDRSVIGHVPLTTEVQECFADGEMKAFFHARMRGTELEIQGRAPWQEW